MRPNRLSRNVRNYQPTLLNVPEEQSFIYTPAEAWNQAGPYWEQLPCYTEWQFSCWCSRVQLKRDGTRWRTGEEVKGKLANGAGGQKPFTLPRNLVYPALLPLMRTPRLPAVDWTDAPADLNGLVRFAERRNLVSARVPSRFKRGLTQLIGEVRSRIVSVPTNFLNVLVGVGKSR